MVNSAEENQEELACAEEERFFGKIQYLRQEYGYIRAKSKIFGIRDITFSYTDTPRSVIEGLSIGDQVSFSLNMYSSGKFSAKDVKRESFAQSTSADRSMSPVTSISSSENASDSAHGHISFCEAQTRCPSVLPSGNSLFSSRDEVEDKPFTSSSAGVTSFSSEVDAFLEKVVMRAYNPSISTCWLQF